MQKQWYWDYLVHRPSAALLLKYWHRQLKNPERLNTTRYVANRNTALLITLRTTFSGFWNIVRRRLVVRLTFLSVGVRCVVLMQTFCRMRVENVDRINEGEKISVYKDIRRHVGLTSADWCPEPSLRDAAMWYQHQRVAWPSDCKLKLPKHAE